MKLFCRLLNVTVLNALAVYRQTIQRKVDHLKLIKSCFSAGLISKYSSSKADRVTFPQKNTSNRKELKTHKTVCCVQQMWEKMRNTVSVPVSS